MKSERRNWVKLSNEEITKQNIGGQICLFESTASTNIRSNCLHERQESTWNCQRAFQKGEGRLEAILDFVFSTLE